MARAAYLRAVAGLALLLFLLVGPQGEAKQAAAAGTSVRWLGHASFLITSARGLRIVLDPYGAGVGYPLPHPTADIVVVSHEHFDHNAISEVRGHFQVVRGPGEHTAKGISFRGIATYHDTSRGRERGRNTVFVFSVDGIRFCHLGDLGHMLSDGQVEEIGPVDVLFVPVGGYFTIDAAVASKVVAQLRPRIVVPMHYQTEVTSPDLPIAGVEPFLKGKPNVKRLAPSSFFVSAAKLPKEQTIFVPGWKD